MKIVRHRSAPHRDVPRSPTCICRSRPDGDVPLFNGLLRSSRATRRDRPRAIVDASHDRLRRGARAPADASTVDARRAATAASPPATLALFFDCSPQTEKTVTVYSPGRQPVGDRHRQGQRHHQLPPGDRPHRQARHGAVLGHRPAQRHGRARGRRARQHARRPHGLREPGASRPRAALLALAGDRRASPASRPSTCSTPSPTGASRRCGSWRPIRSSPCPMPTRCARRSRACPFVVVSDVHARTPTPRAMRMCCCPPPAWGEKDGTVTNSERRISRQRAFLPAPGEARPDWWIVCEVAQAHGLCDAFAYASAGRDLPRARGAVGLRERRRARLRHLRRSVRSTIAHYDALAPVQWPVPRACPTGTPRMFRRRPLLHARTARRASCRSRRAPAGHAPQPATFR